MGSNKFIQKFLGMALLCIWLTGCMRTSDEITTLEPTEIVIANDALLQDAETMAAEKGISVDEAVKYLSLQENIGNLDAQLTKQEENTFAGLWIEYEPEYRVVTSFTENGAATIRPYVEDTPLQALVTVNEAEYSLRELKSLQEEISQLMIEMNLSFSSGINVPENQVEIYVTDQKLWEAMLEERNQQVPEGVAVVVIYEPLTAPVVVLTPAPDIFMPQLRVRSGEYMTALLAGNLNIVDSCLRISASNEDVGWLIIWQPDYFVNDNHGQIEILDRNGQVVGRENEYIEMGGGEIPALSFSPELREPIPEQCEGPYWLMGEIVAEK